MVATGALSAMGFTLALFIADLAFEDPTLLANAQIGVLATSLLAALVGSAALLLASRRVAAGAEDDVLPRRVDALRDHVLGHPDAPLVLVEYGTYGDDGCARFADVVPELRSRLGEGTPLKVTPTDDAPRRSARPEDDAGPGADDDRRQTATSEE